jgi:hypothetical protein
LLTSRSSLADVLAPALQQGKIPSAPGQNGEFVPRGRVIAIPIAEVAVILLADFAPASHKIGAFVVFTDHQVVVPPRFVGRFPSDQILMAVRTSIFTHH